MKKILFLAVAAMMAATASAQSTPLQLKGGWNNGFSGKSDVYSYNITKGYNGVCAEANGILKADYPRFMVILDEPCPAGLQVIYDYTKTDGTTATQYGAVGEANTKGEKEFGNWFFNEDLVSVSKIRLLPSADCDINVKIKAIQIIDNNGFWHDLPLKAEYGCTDNTIYYRGTVSYNKQYQQILFPGLVGMQDKKIKVELAENATNVQMCVDYENIIEGTRKSEWPHFNGKQVIFTTNGGNPITSCGIQYTTETPDDVEVKADVEVAGAWIIADAALTAVQDPKSHGNYYTTFFDGGTAYNIPAGVTAYKGVVEGNALKLTEITGNVIARGEAVLLKSNSANITLTVNNNDGEKEANNELKGLEIAGNAPANCYIFSYAQNGLGFYHVNEGSALAANKAYLVYEAPAGARPFFEMNFDDSAVTGIENVQNDTADQTIYTLSGVRVAQPVRGLNIVGNKKYIVK